MKKSDPKSDSIDRDLAALPTVSARIRYLHAQGWNRGDIARKLNKRYQHVRNVLITPVKKTN